MDIKIQQSTYKRLESLAVGFDTPEQVIIKLLDHFDANSKKKVKPTILFNSGDEKTFKDRLLVERVAEVCLHKVDGQKVYSIWNASKLSKSSNIKANIWSGLLRNWEDKKIITLELTVLPNDFDQDLCFLAHNIGLSYTEAKTVKPRACKEADGYHSISFENEDMTILNKINLNNDLEIHIPSYMVSKAEEEKVLGKS